MTRQSPQKSVVDIVGSGHRIPLAVVLVVLPGEPWLHGLPSDHDEHAPHFGIHRDLRAENGEDMRSDGIILERGIIPVMGICT